MVNIVAGVTVVVNVRISHVVIDIVAVVVQVLVLKNWHSHRQRVRRLYVEHACLALVAVGCLAGTQIVVS